MRSATRLLLALLLLPALATRAFAADLVPCPGGDADCDDGDVCTLDTCGIARTASTSACGGWR